MRISEVSQQAGDLFWRYVPVSAMVLVASYVIGKEILHPQQRMIKALAMALLLTIMLRFEMIFSLYFFVILFPFPSGIALSSTNVVLMTIIPLLWFIRAHSEGRKLFARTDIDALVLALILSYAVSFFNVETMFGIKEGLKVFWRELTAFSLFFLIATFVDSEKKLETFTKVICISAGFVVLTALLELVAPGRTLIPGWITLQQELGKGALGYRIEGIRLGGALKGHATLSDYCVFSLFFMIFHAVRARHPFSKVFWIGLGLATFAVLLATVNRRATIELVVGVVMMMYVFRSRLNPTKLVLIATMFITLFLAGESILRRFTLANSITDRFLGTKFEGGVPDTRTMTWKPTLERATDHLIIGHGPWYDVGAGLDKVFWPHNGYIYFLYTVGIFGLSIFLGIVYRLWRASLEYRNPHVQGTTAQMLLGILHIQLTVFLIGQLATDHQRVADYIYIYIAWALFGLVMAAANLVRKQAAEAMAAEVTHS